MRLFVAVTTVHQRPIYQLDINNAYLRGYLDEDVYMLPPQQMLYAKAAAGQVCLLKKSL